MIIHMYIRFKHWSTNDIRIFDLQKKKKKKKIAIDLRMNAKI